MSKLTLRFTCADCGQVNEDVIAIIDGQRDDQVKEYNGATEDGYVIRCVTCESAYRRTNRQQDTTSPRERRRSAVQ